MKTENLARYLDEQWVGSITTLVLIERLAEHQMNEAERADYLELRERVKADQNLLARLLEVFRWKPNETGRGSPMRKRQASATELGLFESMDLLMLGLAGKRLLWMALREIAPSHPSLAGVDFDRMQEEAKSQRRLIEQKKRQFVSVFAA